MNQPVFSPGWHEAIAFCFPRYHGPGLSARLLWGKESLSFQFEPREEGVCVLFLDPEGDGESYFEIGVDRSGRLQSRVARRSRSGTKFDTGWNCPGATADLGHYRFHLPFAGLGSHTRESGRWRAAAGLYPAFDPLRLPPPWIDLPR